MKLLLKLLAVGLAYACGGFLMVYWARSPSYPAILDSEYVTEFLWLWGPAIAAFALNARILWKALPVQWPKTWKVIATGIAAAIATFIAGCAYLIVVFNLYGT